MNPETITNKASARELRAFPWLGREGRPLAAKRGFGLMGILNLTPDSFYDGGNFTSPRKALAQAEMLLKSGADILDLGGQSTRPHARRLTAAQELARLVPGMRAISLAYPSACISVDTFYAEVARSALELGAQVINDVSALAEDPALAEVVAHYRPGYVLMHNRGLPASRHDGRGGSLLDECKRFFEARMSLLARAGLPEANIVLDPGIGFGKNLHENLDLLRNLDALREFGRPLLVGISMKSFFGDLLGLHLSDRGGSTATAAALLWERGVFWHRVHNVAQARTALCLAEALGPGTTEQCEAKA